MKTKNPEILHKNHTPEASDGFYHKDSPLLFAGHDEITSLDDCPFPLKTDSFEVVLFGKNKNQPKDSFAVVKYEKSCGHTVSERIPFQEGVKDFTSHGDLFIGANYSIKSWKNRIEYFRNQLPCDVCQMVKHSVWIYEIGEGGRSKKGVLKSLLYLLNYNYSNWEEFISIDTIKGKLMAAKRGY